MLEANKKFYQSPHHQPFSTGEGEQLGINLKVNFFKSVSSCVEEVYPGGKVLL
jgi:hypothetical protein